MDSNIPPVTKFLKRLIKGMLPRAVVQAREEYLISRRVEEFRKLTVKAAFTKIYTDGLWGKSTNVQDEFCSGIGSHQSDIVATYVDAVSKFLKSLDKKPNVVDLGCGDFHVGSQVRPLCSNYVACDVVDSLIARNKDEYRDMGVDFRVVDITSDE